MALICTTSCLSTWLWPNQSDTESAKELVSSMAISLTRAKHRIQWLHDNDSADILSWPSLALCSPSTTKKQPKDIHAMHGHQTVTYWKDTRSTTGTTVITEYRTKTPRTPGTLQLPKHHIQTLEALQALLQYTEMPTDMAKDTRSTTGTMVTKAQYKTTKCTPRTTEALWSPRNHFTKYTGHKARF